MYGISGKPLKGACQACMGQEEPRRAHTARIGGRLFPPLFSHVHFAIIVIVFGAGNEVGGKWRPQEEVSFWRLCTFQMGALCTSTEVWAGCFGGGHVKERCVGFFGGGLVPQEGTARWLFWWGPKNKCLPAKCFLLLPKT